VTQLLVSLSKVLIPAALARSLLTGDYPPYHVTQLGSNLVVRSWRDWTALGTGTRN